MCTVSLWERWRTHYNILEYRFYHYDNTSPTRFTAAIIQFIRSIANNFASYSKRVDLWFVYVFLEFSLYDFSSSISGERPTRTRRHGWYHLEYTRISIKAQVRSVQRADQAQQHWPSSTYKQSKLACACEHIKLWTDGAYTNTASRLRCSGVAFASVLSIAVLVLKGPQGYLLARDGSPSWTVCVVIYRPRTIISTTLDWSSG